MYVEIQPRQSGKTTRLVNSVVSFLKENKNKTALIVAKEKNTRKLIQDNIHEKCGDFCSKRTITSHKMFQSPVTMRQLTTLQQHVTVLNVRRFWAFMRMDCIKNLQ